MSLHNNLYPSIKSKGSKGENAPDQDDNAADPSFLKKVNPEPSPPSLFRLDGSLEDNADFERRVESFISRFNAEMRLQREMNRRPQEQIEGISRASQSTSDEALQFSKSYGESTMNINLDLPKVEESSASDESVSDKKSHVESSFSWIKGIIGEQKMEGISRASQCVFDEALQSSKSNKKSGMNIDILKAKESTALDKSVSDVALLSITDHKRSSKMSCIFYSFLFGANFEFDKDSMVQLWVAEGIFEPENEEIMEIVGSTVFDSMVEYNLFMPLRFDNLYGQLFKVNKNMLVSNLFEGEEQLPMEDFMLADEAGLASIPSTIKHLSLICENFDLHIVEVLKGFTGMRTLMLHCECATCFNHLSHDLFLHLKCLRTLDLHQLHITELPSCVGDLECLRYLDVSETFIKYLPETVDSLYLLQTLKLKGCLQLCRLPKNTRHLVTLRHLDLDIIGQLKSMPVGIGSLTSLQTLSGFLVGKEDGCHIAELRNLVNLRGSLCISRLENISSPNKAKQANLSNKKHISKLQLQWSTCHSDKMQVEEEILECLQPHFGLKELEILFFNGSKLPSWISDPSFAQIVKITLFKCRNCSLLPSLGILPSLRFLEIYEMNGVKVIDEVFHRKNGVQKLYAFPKLEKLELDTLLNLEVWDGMDNCDFPNLLECRFKQCPKLISLPLLSHLHSLKHLEIIACLQLQSLPDDGIPASVETIIIKDCPRIIEQCGSPNGRDWSKIAHVPSVFLDYEEISIEQIPKTY